MLLATGAAPVNGLARAKPETDPVTLTVISIAVESIGLVAKLVELTSSSDHEALIAVPRWVCSAHHFDYTIIGWRRRWYELGIYPIYRGWVCTEVECLNQQNVPESMVPDIQQCPTLGQRRKLAGVR